ncbi:unnamed protein product [Trifolium pratense]|uniref:Uncharacterized protein n=1 Tax=Trifolium pratense TaxID=57577 RepID=A0ACB0LIJ4_TRIPR|nr:unnamed protein product [Trifolium pratense]
MWNRLDIKVHLIKTNFHFLHVQVKEKDVDPWLLTVVYASPRENERSETWHHIRQLASNITEPWLVMGDFNEIASPDEKKGGVQADIGKCLQFNRWINECNLMEVTTAGTKFTWRGPLWNGRDRVFKKLDRVLCNVSWRLKYHDGFAKVLPRVQSDHHPIIVFYEGEPNEGRNRPFRFEAAWNTHENFKQVLQENWNRGRDLVFLLNNLTDNLKVWNKEVFGNIFKRKKELLARLNGIQNSRNYGYSNFLESLEKELQDQLATTLYQEECLWYQKSRGKWIADGDRNTNPNDLWCKILYSKYGRNTDLRVSMNMQPYDSPLWKALAGIGDQFRCHTVWQVGNGQQINFWLDKWMPNGHSLMNFSTQQTIDTTLTVKDILTNMGEWDINFLTTHLPHTIVNQLVAIPAPKDTDGPDLLGWGGTSTRQFTVQSAYNLQRGNNISIAGNWESLWSWNGPHRIQTFLWIATHERLLTNYRRSKWGNGISPTCPSCGNDDETIIHVLRDCIHATQIWIRLVASNHITNFFSLSLSCRDWIFDNISGAHNKDWQTIFMVTCWYLWMWRNKSIFEEGFRRPSNPTHVIFKMVTEIDRCKQAHVNGRPQQKDTIFIGWKQPQEGWIKLNCDGAHKSSINLSGCGGLLRDSYGNCLSSFARKIGSCDALHAEMWGMYIGMNLARRQGITHLQVESDSKMLVDMVTGNCNVNGNIPTLIKRIRDLKNMNWHVQFNHTWREGNRSADWLANFSLTLNSFDLHVLESPPRELQSLIFDDVSGACMPRSVRIVF